MKTGSEYSVWILPAEPLYSQLSDMIRKLGAHYGAVEFDPHLTLCSAPSNDFNAASLLEALGGTFRVVHLDLLQVRAGLSYTKSLFVEVACSQGLRDMHRAAAAINDERRSHDFNPHLSLLYKDLNEDDRRKLVTDTTAPQGSFRFDRIRVIETEVPVVGPDAIRRWRTVGEVELT